MSCPTPLIRNINGFLVPVPCGKCLSCHIDVRNMWTWRICAELKDKDGVFLTLTIDDDNILPSRSVYKRSCQLFFKRLRKKLGDRKIKYFCVSEYGSLDMRPHYHCIITNLTCGRYLSFDTGDYNIVRQAWPFGFIDMKPASKANIRYVLKYLDKMQDVEDFCKDYPSLNPPFRLISNGIGADWIKSLLSSGFLGDNNTFYFDGSFRPLPRYYKDKLGLIDKYRSDYSDVSLWSRLTSNPNKAEYLLKHYKPSGSGFYHDLISLNSDFGRQQLLDLEKKVFMKK